MGVSLQFHGFRFRLVYRDQTRGCRPRRDPAARKGRVLVPGTQSEKQTDLDNSVLPICRAIGNTEAAAPKNPQDPRRCASANEHALRRIWRESDKRT